MSIEIRVPEQSDGKAMFAADARGFGTFYEDDEVERRLPIMDLSRFRIALDGAAIVGVAGSFALDMTVPGGASVPMGGVTWVSVAATHRRQGILRRLLGAVHADIDARGEPVAGLSASEGGIYGRFGYGVATQMRRVVIDVRAVQLRDELVPKPGSVRFMEPDEARVHVPAVWERARGQRPGETARNEAWWGMVFEDQAKAQDGFSPALRLRHDDGYASYRVRMVWNEGRPAHEVNLIELVAATDDAHLALWHTLLGIDLVATITSRRGFTIDDALHVAVDNPRAVSTEALDDCVWLRPHQPAVLLGARTYTQRGPSRPGAVARHDRCRRRGADPLGGRGRTRRRGLAPDPSPSRSRAGPCGLRRHLPRRLPTLRPRPRTADHGGDARRAPAGRRLLLRRTDAQLAEPVLIDNASPRRRPSSSGVVAEGRR